MILPVLPDLMALMGATGALSGTAGLVAPLAFPTLFAAAVARDTTLSGLPFLAAAAMTGCAGAIA